jgi:tetratricopeptide (TPR) repeat protein
LDLLRELLGWDVEGCLQRAEKYERIGKLGMARLELENALEVASLKNEAQRRQINERLDRILSEEQKDLESQAQDALSRGDSQRARYFLNAALSKLEEGNPEFDRVAAKLDSIPESSEEAEVEDELNVILRADVGVRFLDQQRALEFWKSGFPPYKEEYYFNKALTSEVIKTQVAQVNQNPGDADANFNLGLTLAQLGLIGKALEQIRRFVLLKPEDRDGHYMLANLLADEGVEEEAIREFEKTISIDPNFTEARFYLAELYYRLDDFDSAAGLYHLVAEMEKGGNLSEDSRMRMQAIKKQQLTNSYGI